MGAWRKQRPRGQAAEFVEQLAHIGFVGTVAAWRDQIGFARSTIEDALRRLDGVSVKRLPDRLLKTPGRRPSMHVIYGPVGCSDDALLTCEQHKTVSIARHTLDAYPASLGGGNGRG